MSSDNSKKTKRLKSISIHEGRLRKLIQFLKEKEAVIRVDHDPYGNAKSTTYSSSKRSDHKLKEFILSIWPETTDSAYYEYLRTDYKIHRRSTAKAKHHPSYEKFIKDIRCTFMENAHIDQIDHKEQLFFSGARPEQTNILAAFPHFRQEIVKEANKFVELLESQQEGFPYQQLRNHTSHRCHRFKQLEKDIFQHLKDTNSSTLQLVRGNFANVMSSLVKHLEILENKGIGHEQPDGKHVVKNRLRLKELSDPEEIEISCRNEEKMKEIGFGKAFSEQSQWFDELRFKKITYWKNKLRELPIEDWPPYFLEHILLAYFELNTICSQIIALRDQLFEEVGFYVTYSKDGQEIFTIEEFLSPADLSILLSNYEYKSNAFVDALRSDGNLLREPLQRLPQNFDKIASPDNLFYSRIQKLIWEYLLFRMCDSCQLSKEHIAEFYTPLFKPN